MLPLQRGAWLSSPWKALMRLSQRKRAFPLVSLATWQRRSRAVLILLSLIPMMLLLCLSLMALAVLSLMRKRPWVKVARGTPKIIAILVLKALAATEVGRAHL